MKREPRLSIGVPVYNGERFLPGLFAALAAQTFQDFEIIVADNASTDRTAQICREWAARDPRIRYHRNAQNIGASGNFNLVFSLAKAPLFKWAACDDTFAPEYLEACVSLLDAHPDVVVAQTDVVCIDDKQRPFERDAETGAFVIPGTTLLYSVDPIDIGESKSAVRRYYDVLFRCRSNAQIFGVMRRDALARTGLIANFMGAEKATVLELSLTGKFAQDRRALFFRCYHPGITEVKTNSESKAYIAVAETNYSRSMRMLGALLATPLGKPVGIGTKISCYTLLIARSLSFAVRSVTRAEAKEWPFRAAWGATKSGGKAI